MADPFATGLGTLHRGPGSVAAEYFVQGAGPAIPLRAIWDRQSRTASVGDTEVVVPAVGLSIQRSDIAAPAEGDEIAIGDDRYFVAAEPMLDAEGVSWMLDVEPVPA